MTDREKLVELIAEAGIKYATIEGLADHLIANGVTVREMQKPLTVEELQNETVYWYEERNDDLIPVEIGRFTNFIELYFIGCDYPFDEKKWDYGKTWRCWAEKPTDEERKAAEWYD